MSETAAASVFEYALGDWWAECLVCNAWVTTSNPTQRNAEQNVDRLFQNEHATAGRHTYLPFGAPSPIASAGVRCARSVRGLASPRTPARG